MPAVTIVYWRDIPAQVIVGKGRSASKMPLPERFEQAIDRCAMKIGAKGGDDYMADPPPEEQGLNTVFDQDKSTWNVIQSFTKRLH